MKPLISMVPVLLLASLAFAQARPPAPAVSLPQDTVKQTGPCQGMMNTASMPMRPGEGKQMFPGHGMNFRRDGREAGNDKMGCPGVRPMRHRICGPRALRCCPPFICCGFMFIGLLLWGIINILLTVLVSLDMSKNGRFNGLWIPLLLIAGIPVSIIYALFRIGDRVQCRQE